MSKYYGGFFDFPKEIMKTVKTGIRNKASADAIRAANRDNRKAGGMMKKKKKKSFPDMSGDGKVTKKDILMAKGIIKKPMKKKKK
jgi:hypothetical protein